MIKSECQYIFYILQIRIVKHEKCFQIYIFLKYIQLYKYQLTKKNFNTYLFSYILVFYLIILIENITIIYNV